MSEHSEHHAPAAHGRTNGRRTEDGEHFCLLDLEDGVLRVGIVGVGPGLRSILDIIENEQYHEFIPPLRLVAVSDADGREDRRAMLAKRGVPTYPGWQEMLAAHPDIDLLIELTGSLPKLRRLRREAPDNVALIDHTAAFFLCGLHNLAQYSKRCRLDLNHHKALLEAIIDEVQDDIMLLDLHGRVVDANRNVRRRLDKDKAELVGLPCYEVERLDDGTPFCSRMDEKCPFRATLRSGEKAEALVTRVDKAGHLKYFRVYTYPIYQAGQLTNIVVMRRDITSRTERERREHQAEKLAAIGEMSTYLAHEIRNPLFAIGGFTQSLLNTGSLTDKDRQKLTIIAEEARRLDHMLTSILNFARPSHAPEQDVDICGAVEETVELMRIGYAKLGYTFTLACGSELPRVRGDVEMVKQCLMNVLKNAMEATECGGEILVSTGLDTQYVTITVRDHGKGMSEDDLAMVFSPFFSTKEKGYGLGLAMIKKLIEEVGGKVDIASRLGEGTTVTLCFPPVLARSAQPPGGEGAPGGPAAPGR